MSSPPTRLIIASRASPLAMQQSIGVQAFLQQKYPDCEVSILAMSTKGDQILDRSLASIGGKGLFIKELEQALLDGRADLAVHSMKDVPSPLAEEFTIAGIGERADPRDAFVSTHYAHINEIPQGGTIGTGSLRRVAQIRRLRPDLQVKPLRGNVGTRLGKLAAGEYQAIILATAGLQRLSLHTEIRHLLPISDFLPAPGQGALGLEILTQRKDLLHHLEGFNHPPTALAVQIERAVNQKLGGSCSLPLAVHAYISAEEFWLRAMLADPLGKHWFQTEVKAPIEEAQTLVVKAVQELFNQGAKEWLEEWRQQEASPSPR